VRKIYSGSRLSSLKSSFLFTILSAWGLLLPSLQGSTQNNFEDSSYITYEFSGGRFGDSLLSYLHAKWLSYCYHIPLLYKPFTYSSQLMLHDREMHFSQFNRSKIKLKEVFLEKEEDLIQSLKKPSQLYICPYFPECIWERAHTKGPHGKAWSYIPINWKDAEFRKQLKELIAPKQNYPLTTPPQNTVNIAIHFREGGGYDPGEFALHFMTKLPPFNFYVEGLLKVVELFKGKSLYCYLFTDAQNPLQVVESLKNALPAETPIIFDCRSVGNFHNRNVLEDFFSLFLFDVLIHPQSNFSLIPSLIHDYTIVYSPLSACQEGGVVTIDKIKMEVNEKAYHQLLSRID